MNCSTEPRPGQGTVGSVGCAHGQSPNKVLLETSFKRVCTAEARVRLASRDTGPPNVTMLCLLNMGKQG